VAESAFCLIAQSLSRLGGAQAKDCTAAFVQVHERRWINMDVLLILNNATVKNVRVMVTLNNKKLKEQIISLLEKGNGEAAFDILFKNAKPSAYYPPDVEIPRRSMLITLDEALIKGRQPDRLSRFDKDNISNDPLIC